VHLITPFYGELLLHIDKIKTITKQFFRLFDPFWHITRWRASAIFVINSAAANVINCPAKTYHLPAVGCAKATVPKEEQPISPKFIVLSIGRLVPLKGFDLTIAAFAKFWNALPAYHQINVRLEVVGKGEMRNNLQQLAQQLGIQNQVDWVEWMPQAELPQHYHAASVFLFPSHEGAGMVIPEALSYSLPIVCLDNVGPGEFITPQCGIAVNPNQHYEKVVEDLAKALTQLYLQTDDYQRLAAGALSHWQANFEWQAKAEKINQIYQKIQYGS
jgi:glycosyltransferase involved in cell wall biosynthesis